MTPYKVSILQLDPLSRLEVMVSARLIRIHFGARLQHQNSRTCLCE